MRIRSEDPEQMEREIEREKALVKELFPGKEIEFKLVTGEDGHKYLAKIGIDADTVNAAKELHFRRLDTEYKIKQQVQEGLHAPTRAGDGHEPREGEMVTPPPLPAVAGVTKGPEKPGAPTR